MPSPTSTRKLPDELVEHLLEAYIDQVAGPDPRFLFGVSLEALCAALYGPARCGRDGDAEADNRLWKYACGKFGDVGELRQMHWRDVFHRIGLGDVTWVTSGEPLHWASKHGHVGVVQALLARGASVHRRQGGARLGKTALVLACKYGHKDVVDVLIRHGASVNVRYGEVYATPLMAASKEGHIDIVQQLLDAGAHLHSYDKDGWTAFTYARMYVQKDVFDLLVRVRARFGR